MSDAGYLLDTNVLSETRLKRPNARVLAFMDSLRRHVLYVSVLTVGELRKGAALRGQVNRSEGESLDLWIDGVEARFEGRILPVDLSIARLWAVLSASRPRPIVDTLLAATAIKHELTLVTRNVRDVADTGVGLVNPWDQAL